MTAAGWAAHHSRTRQIARVWPPCPVCNATVTADPLTVWHDDGCPPPDAFDDLEQDDR